MPEVVLGKIDGDLDDRSIEGYEFHDIIWKELKARSEAHPVHLLRLTWIQDDITTQDVVGWISCLVGDEIKELDVGIETTFQRRYCLPNCLFSCGTENLVCLKLNGFIVLGMTTDLFAFLSLKVLELINILYSEEDSLSTILSSCTVIEDLKLQIGVQPLESLRVTFSMSTLKRFQYRLLSKGPTCEFKIDTPAHKFCNFRRRLDKKFEWKSFQRLLNQELQIEMERNVMVEENVNRISGFLEPLVGVHLLALSLDLDTTFLLCRTCDQEITFDQLSPVKIFGGLSSTYELFIKKFLAQVPRLKFLFFAREDKCHPIHDRNDGFLDDEVPEWKLPNLASLSCEGLLRLSSKFDQLSQMVVTAADLKILKVFIESQMATKKKAEIQQKMSKMAQDCQIQFEENEYKELDTLGEETNIFEGDWI
nr:putative F-box/FBD/LRR-repeat protein At4g00315 [Quercus suber]POF25823.1 putative f-box/fbd/lrr-repeat protein [Quercus suber]